MGGKSQSGGQQGGSSMGSFANPGQQPFNQPAIGGNVGYHPPGSNAVADPNNPQGGVDRFNTFNPSPSNGGNMWGGANTFRQDPNAANNRAQNPNMQPVNRFDNRFGGNTGMVGGNMYGGGRGGSYSPWGGGNMYGGGAIGNTRFGRPNPSTYNTGIAGGNVRPNGDQMSTGGNPTPQQPQQPAQRMPSWDMQPQQSPWGGGGNSYAAQNQNSQMMGRLMQMLGSYGGRNRYQSQSPQWNQGSPQGGMQGQTSLYGRRY